MSPPVGTYDLAESTRPPRARMTQAAFAPTPLLLGSSISVSLIASTTMSSVFPAISSSPKESEPGAENSECRLLGPFALFIQGALGLLALLALVYKRWRERPQRPVKVWAFDASKQVLGSGLLHVANLLMSMISSGELSGELIVTAATAGQYQANPCSFYLLNLAIDTTLGIPILIVLLRLLTHGFSLTPLGKPRESIQSGNYGQPPRTSWWLKQSVIYFIGLIGMKLCVYFIFKLCPWIIQVGDWALRWTEGDEKIQVFFVMLFFPLVMNAIQYYIIDSFIKDQKPKGHDRIPQEDSEDEDDPDGVISERRRRPRTSDEGPEDVSDISSDDEIAKSSKATKISEVEDKCEVVQDVKPLEGSPEGSPDRPNANTTAERGEAESSGGGGDRERSPTPSERRSRRG